MNFESELKKGNMVISECLKCKKITWPPSNFCNHCLNENSWRKCSKYGKIIEFSKKNNIYFCVVELENSLRLLGKITSGNPKIGKEIKIEDCGIKDNNYFLKIKVLE